MKNFDISTENILESLAELLEMIKDLKVYKESNENQVETLNKQITEQNSIIDSLKIDYSVLKDQNSILQSEKNEYSNKNKVDQVKLKDLKQIKDDELNLRVMNEELNHEQDKLLKLIENLTKEMQEKANNIESLNKSLNEQEELLKKTELM
jgi:peptidoglycan hydrolase CwlO-like protein